MSLWDKWAAWKCAEAGNRAPLWADFISYCARMTRGYKIVSVLGFVDDVLLSDDRGNINLCFTQGLDIS